MNRWRAEYDDGIWRFYRDGMELGLYEKGDVVVDALNAAESRIAELEGKIDQLTAHSDIERQDDKSSNDVATPIDVALRKRIAKLEAERRWRVVADGELPEVYRDEDGDFIPFLVCEGDGDYPFTARYDGINWRAGIFVPDITHWMPLPELPEVK